MQPLLLCKQYRTEEYTYLTLDSSKEPLKVKKYGIDGTLIDSTTYPAMNFAKFISSELNREESREERLNLFCQSFLEKLLEKREQYPPALQTVLEENLEKVKQKKVDEALATLTEFLLQDPNVQAVIKIIDPFTFENILLETTIAKEPLLAILQKLEFVKGKISEIFTSFMQCQKNLQQFVKKMEENSGEEQRKNFTLLVKKVTSTLEQILSKPEYNVLHENCLSLKSTLEAALKGYLRFSEEESKTENLDLAQMQEGLNKLAALFFVKQSAEQISSPVKWSKVSEKDEFALDILKKLEEEVQWQIQSLDLMLKNPSTNQGQLNFVNNTLSSLKDSLRGLIKWSPAGDRIGENIAKLKKLQPAIHAMGQIFSKENSYFQNMLLPIFALSLLNKKEKEGKEIGILAAYLFSFDTGFRRTIYEKLIDLDPTFWDGYWVLAKIYTDPLQKAHLLLRGACSAIQAKNFPQAKSFCEKSLGESCKEPFVNELAFLELYAMQGQSALVGNRVTRYAESHCANALFNVNASVEVSTESSFKVQWIKEEIYINKILLRLNLGALKVYSTLCESYKKLREIEPARSVQKVILWSLRCMDSYLASGMSSEAESIRKELLDSTNNLQDVALLTWDSYPLFMKLAPSLQEQSKVKECAVAYFRATLLASQRENVLEIATSLQKLQEVDPELKLLEAQDKIVVKILQTNNNLQQVKQFLTKMGYTITFKKGLCLEGQRVILEGNAFDRLMSALKQISSLQELNLANTIIGDIRIGVLARALQEHTKLEVLNLSNTMMGEQGLQALIPLFPKLASLQKLVLSGNSIYDAGAEELAKGLKNLPTLQQLDLSDNYMGERGIAALKQEVQNSSILQGLDRQSKQPKPGISFAPASPPNPLPFNFGTTSAPASNPFIFPTVPPKDASNTPASTSNLPSFTFGKREQGGRTSTSTPKPTSFNFSGSFSFPVVPPVAPLPRSKLEFNDSSESEFGSAEKIGEVVKKLKEQPSLDILTLTGFRFDASNIISLAEGLKIVPRLKELYLACNQISDVCLSLLVESLQGLTELEALDLSGNPFGDSGASCVALVLKKFRYLKMLNLQNTLLTNKGEEQLFEAIEKLSTLTSLNFSNNKIANTPKLLYYTSTLLGGLQDLDFSHNQIDPLYTNAIGEMVALKTLRLNNNAMKDNGITSLATNLKKISFLQTLDLSHNQFGDSAVIQLSDSLKGLPPLEYLNLSHNQFGDSGLIQLAQALSKIPLLKTLILSNNRIEDVGAGLLASKLSELTSLETVDLSGNKIGAEGKAKLLEAAKGLPQLKLCL